MNGESFCIDLCAIWCYNDTYLCQETHSSYPLQSDHTHHRNHHILKVKQSLINSSIAMIC